MTGGKSKRCKMVQMREIDSEGRNNIKKCMEKRIVPKVEMRRKQHIKVCKELDNQQLK